MLYGMTQFCAKKTAKTFSNCFSLCNCLGNLGLLFNPFLLFIMMCGCGVESICFGNIPPATMTSSMIDEMTGRMARVTQAEIRVKPMVYVSSNQVLLGDLADLHGFDPSVQKEMIKVVVLENASVNMTLSEMQITEKLRQKITNGLSSNGSVLVKVPKTVRIEINYGISRASVEAALLEKFQTGCGDCSFLIEDLRLPRITGMKDSTPWELNLANTSNAGAFTVPLFVHLPHGPETYWVTGVVKMFKNVLVTKKVINIDAKLTASDFVSKQVDVTYLKDTPATEQELAGQSLRRTLGAGQVILRNDIRRNYALTRGQVTKVILAGNGYDLAIQAIAEQNGYVGDVIRLKNLESQRMITGVVTEKGVVRVE